MTRYRYEVSPNQHSFRIYDNERSEEANMKIDPNWMLILNNAWSARIMLGGMVASIVVAIESGSGLAVLNTILLFLATVSRVVVQPVLRAQLEQSSENVEKLK